MEQQAARPIDEDYKDADPRDPDPSIRSSATAVKTEFVPVGAGAQALAALMPELDEATPSATVPSGTKSDTVLTQTAAVARAVADGPTNGEAMGRSAASATAESLSAETQPKARRQSEGAPAPIIPDCCNIGVALRSIVIANLASLTLALAQQPSWPAVGERLLEIAMLLEPALFGSLICLCLVRRWANGQPLRLQWVVGLGVPMLVTGGIAWWLAPFMGIEGTGQPQEWIATRMLLACFAAMALLEYFRLRARAYAPSFSEARLQALQARIRPHFLFNSLNTVLGLIRTDPRRAEHTLENLADLFRVFMRDARELVALDDEVLTCKEYLAIEQLRLTNRLRIVWDIDEMPGDALIPSLLLQPLLENAVHHGIEPSTEQGTLNIRITHPGDRVRVEIDNPVSATPPTRSGNQMALSNVRERLMLLYDMEADLKTSIHDERFHLQLEFPYRKERRRRDVRRHHIHPDR